VGAEVQDAADPQKHSRHDRNAADERRRIRMLFPDKIRMVHNLQFVGDIAGVEYNGEGCDKRSKAQSV